MSGLHEHRIGHPRARRGWLWTPLGFPWTPCTGVSMDSTFGTLPAPRIVATASVSVHRQYAHKPSKRVQIFHTFHYRPIFSLLN